MLLHNLLTVLYLSSKFFVFKFNLGRLSHSFESNEWKKSAAIGRGIISIDVTPCHESRPAVIRPFHPLFHL